MNDIYKTFIDYYLNEDNNCYRIEAKLIKSTYFWQYKVEISKRHFYKLKDIRDLNRHFLIPTSRIHTTPITLIYDEIVSDDIIYSQVKASKKLIREKYLCKLVNSL